MKHFALRSLILAISVTAACSEQANTDLAFQFRETPLRQIQGVEIGMPAKDLRRARSAARYAPFLGMQETIPGYSVSYQFNRAMNEDPKAEVPGDDKLLAVYVAHRFDSDETAAADWREEVAAVTKARGAPKFCERLPNGGQQAGWEVGSLALVIGVFPPDANSPAVTSRTLTAVSTLGAMKKPTGATPATCPTP